MDFLELAKERFSVRSYKNIPVEEKKLIQVLEAARIAPSAVNFQPWHFIVVQQKENLNKIHKIYAREWIKQAPVIIVACSDHSESWKRASDNKDSADIDIAIAVDHITLMAASLGLGTCWVCNFDVKQCSEIFQLPPHIEPVVLIPLGYPDTNMPVKKRKSISEIASSESFKTPFI